MNARVPETAMVLAAGLGKRMRPITDTLPKPLVVVSGKTLLDRGLDALAQAGVKRAVVNVHHLADRMVAHLAARSTPQIMISDERERLLDSAGGIVNALPQLGEAPFFVLNADTFWVDRGQSNLVRLADAWNDAEMDMLLMIADPRDATGHGEGVDFLLGDDARLVRAGGAQDGFIYAGAAIIHPRIFAGKAAEPHSLNRYFDDAIATGRLAGLPLEGHWITVGTPSAIDEAEDALLRLGAAGTKAG